MPVREIDRTGVHPLFYLITFVSPPPKEKRTETFSTLIEAPAEAVAPPTSVVMLGGPSSNTTGDSVRQPATSHQPRR